MKNRLSMLGILIFTTLSFSSLEGVMDPLPEVPTLKIREQIPPLPPIGALYEYYKDNKQYRILDRGDLHVTFSEFDGALVVVYQLLNTDMEFEKSRVRIKFVDDFMGMVMYKGKIVPRFTYIHS